MKFRSLHIVVAALAVAGLSAGAAYADGGAVAANTIGNQQIVVSTSSASSASTRAVAAPCFGSRRVTGGGADIDGNTDKPAIRSSWPFSNRHWAAEATEVDPTSAFWNLDARAICWHIGTAVTYQIVSTTTTTDSTIGGVDVKYGTVACPTGTVAVGGGADVNNPNVVDVVLRTSRPTAGQAGWEALANETDPTTQAWTMTTYAICISASAFASRTVVTTNSPSGSATFQQADAVCPAGHRLTGGGADVTGGLGTVTLRTIAPVSSMRWTVIGQEEDPEAGNWFVTAHAVCVQPAPAV